MHDRITSTFIRLDNTFIAARDAASHRLARMFWQRLVIAMCHVAMFDATRREEHGLLALAEMSLVVERHDLRLMRNP